MPRVDLSDRATYGVSRVQMPRYWVNEARNNSISRFIKIVLKQVYRHPWKQPINEPRMLDRGILKPLVRNLFKKFLDEGFKKFWIRGFLILSLLKLPDNKAFSVDEHNVWDAKTGIGRRNSNVADCNR